MTKESEQDRLNRKAALIAVGVFIAWAIVVALSGSGFSLLPVDWDFARTGQLGDSFGIIGAAMASVAAYFAFQTYTLQHEETTILRAERKDAAKLRAEPSFLNLLERRYDALKQFNFAPGANDYPGLSGIDRVAHVIAFDVTNYGMPPLDAYRNRMRDASNHPHLFRFTYHIVRYAELHFDGKSGDDRLITRRDLSYRYVSLFRSQLSDSELMLLALNVLTPDGAGAKRLYERYALFHNLSSERKKLVQAAGEWDDRAFGLPPEPDEKT